MQNMHVKYYDLINIACIYDVYVNLIHHYPMELSRANTNKLKHCEQKEVLKTQLAGGRSIGYKQNTADELRLG